MKYIYSVIVAAALVVCGFIYFQKPEAPQVTFGNTLSQPMPSVATTSAAISVTASTRVLATTTNALGDGSSYTRRYATICNPSSTVVYLGLNQDKAVNLAGGATGGIPIAAAAGYNVCYEITDRNPYQGSVVASSTVGAVSVVVTDYVY